MKKLEFWGAILTAAYLSLIGWWLSVNWAAFLSLKLNELGDFLAGTFGPVAFLWLVLGFIQQGRQLNLQAEELQNSVVQQTNIARATHAQVEAQIAAMDAERARYEEQFLARLIFRPKHSVTSGNTKTKYFDIQNLGGDAVNLTVGMDPPSLGGDIRRLGVLHRSSSVEFSFQYELDSEDVSALIVLSYETINGAPQAVLFDYELKSKEGSLTVALNKG